MMKILCAAFILFQIGLVSTSDDMFYSFVDRERLSVSQSVLDKADELADLHEMYKEDWIKSYISTEVSVVTNSKVETVVGESGHLNVAQKELLSGADVGSNVTIKVRYLPKNKLRDNPIKEMDYSYRVMPSQAASFIGGEKELDLYVNNHIFSKLTAAQKEKAKIAKLNFTVSADGSIIEANIQEGSGDFEIDTVLKEAICEMPDWSPAQKRDASPTAQLIRFFVSNAKGACLMY